MSDKVETVSTAEKKPPTKEEQVAKSTEESLANTVSSLLNPYEPSTGDLKEAEKMAYEHQFKETNRILNSIDQNATPVNYNAIIADDDERDKTKHQLRESVINKVQASQEIEKVAKTLKPDLKEGRGAFAEITGPMGIEVGNLRRSIRDIYYSLSSRVGKIMSNAHKDYRSIETINHLKSQDDKLNIERIEQRIANQISDQNNSKGEGFDNSVLPTEINDNPTEPKAA